MELREMQGEEVDEDKSMTWKRNKVEDWLSCWNRQQWWELMSHLSYWPIFRWWTRDIT